MIELTGIPVLETERLVLRAPKAADAEGYVRFMHLLSPILADEVGDADAYESIADAVAVGDADAAKNLSHALLSRGTEAMTALMEALGREQEETP